MKRTERSLKIIIELLELYKIWYRVVGGIAVDAHNGSRTRSHYDIDTIVLQQDVEAIKNLLEEKGYNPEMKDHQILAKVAGTRVEFMIFVRENGVYHLSNKDIFYPGRTDRKAYTFSWPEEMFEGKRLTCYKTELNVPSIETLLSMKMCSKRSKDIADVKTMMGLGANKETAKKYKLPPFPHPIFQANNSSY